MANVEIAAVVEPDSRRLQAGIELLDGVDVFSDYDDMLRQVHVDGVIVCSANALHKEIVIGCARAGKAILCEKPLATTSSDAREMLAICQAHNALLGICFPVRFSSSLIRAKQLFESGAIGQLLAVKATNRGTMPGGWFTDPELAGGGAIMDHTVHVVDCLRWFLGSEFVTVFAHAATRLYDIPVDDVGLLTLEMSNDTFVTLDASWSRPNMSFPLWGDFSLEFIGSDGILTIDLLAWTLNFFSEDAGKHLVIARDGDLNRKLLDNFVQAILGQEPISATGLDGLRALEVVEAAYDSVASGRVVAL